MAVRHAFTDVLAADLRYGAASLTGSEDLRAFKGSDFGVRDTKLGSRHVSAGLELQMVRAEQASVALFAGWQQHSPELTYDRSVSTAAGASGTALTVDTVTSGFPVGLKAAFSAGDFRIAPWLMHLRFTSGKQKLTYPAGNPGTPPTREEAKDYAARAYGVDVEYAPWGLSVGAAWQNVPQEGDHEYDTFLLQAAWRWKGRCLSGDCGEGPGGLIEY